MMALTRADIDQMCKQLVDDLKARREALYPPGEKRKLPADIPTLQQMRDMRKLVVTIRAGMLALHDDIEPRKRPTSPLKLTEAMATFLGLTPAFSGYYKRELLVKALNIYATVRGLVVDGGIMLDDDLALATCRSTGELLPRQQVFGLVSSAFEPSSEHTKSAVHPRVLKALEKEKDELQSVSDAIAYVRRTKQHRDRCLTSKHKDLLVQEAKGWSAEVSRAEEALLQCVAQTRLFADVTQVVVDTVADVVSDE